VRIYPHPEGIYMPSVFYYRRNMSTTEKSTVYLCECKEYDEKLIKGLIENVAEQMGGMGCVLPQKDKKVLIKPNLLTKATPEKAVTTHPAVFGAVASFLRDSGYGNLTFGDSPGTHYMGADKVAEFCGILDKAKEYGVPLADFEGGEEVAYPEGKAAKSFIIANGVLDCDCIVNVCKMKTHMLERMTGAQKNLFGIVYGFNKGATHVKYPNSVEFAKALADLNRRYVPVLHVMDAIEAMEGNGPSGGVPRYMGKLLISQDPVALDTVACALMDLSPELVPTNVIGEEFGVGNMNGDNIKIVYINGDEQSELTVNDVREKLGCKEFDVYRGAQDKGKISYLEPFKPLLQKKPVIDGEKCVGCGVCVQSCPAEPKAVYIKKGEKIPRYNYRRCIKCFCCQEMCPRHAISAGTSRLARFIDRNWKL